MSIFHAGDRVIRTAGHRIHSYATVVKMAGNHVYISFDDPANPKEEMWCASAWSIKSVDDTDSDYDMD